MIFYFYNTIIPHSILEFGIILRAGTTSKSWRYIFLKIYHISERGSIEQLIMRILQNNSPLTIFSPKSIATSRQANVRHSSLPEMDKA